MDGGKFKRKLSEVNTRAVSRRQNELVAKEMLKNAKMFKKDKTCLKIIKKLKIKMFNSLHTSNGIPLGTWLCMDLNYNIPSFIS
jgi:hypothetical protein